MRPVGDKLFQEDGQTDMATLTIASRDFANGPKNWNLTCALNKCKIIIFRK